jgi:hypothetical protein
MTRTPATDSGQTSSPTALKLLPWWRLCISRTLCAPTVCFVATPAIYRFDNSFRNKSTPSTARVCGVLTSITLFHKVLSCTPSSTQYCVRIETPQKTLYHMIVTSFSLAPKRTSGASTATCHAVRRSFILLVQKSEGTTMQSRASILSVLRVRTNCFGQQ